MVADPRKERPTLGSRQGVGRQEAILGSTPTVVASPSVAARQEATHFRAHPRRSVRLHAIVSTPQAGSKREANVRDISLGGVGITLPETLRKGEHVVVSVLAPSLWDPLALPARVAWAKAATSHEPAAAGLAFEPKDPLGVFGLFELVATLGSR
jgi:hypothetical protein